MTQRSGSSQVTKDSRKDRGDAARQKLLTAAIDVFGRLGFDGASTRTLADAAGVNQHAIAYYFGDKEGLYIAVAEHIAALVAAQTADLRGRIQARLDAAETHAAPLEESEARGLLTDLVQTMAALFVSRESEPWARFVIREQMEPTEAFKRLYGGLMKPGLEMTGRLIAIILGEPPGSEHIRLRTLSLIGSVLMFRTAHATALAQLGWKTVGPREVDVVRSLATELVASITRRETRP